MTKQRYQRTYDLTNCDAEPLRFIRSCQAHTEILVFYAADLTLKAYSENYHARLPGAPAVAHGQRLQELLPGEVARQLLRMIDSGDFVTGSPILNVRTDEAGAEVRENVTAHRSGDLLVVEFEPRDESTSHIGFLMQVDSCLQRIQQAGGSKEVFDVTVREVKDLVGYDRVWLYQFDEQYNGEIIAEARHTDLPPFLNLRYPHTDIPEQARQLYLKQQIRLVTSTRADSDHLLIADDAAPIDLSMAANRGVSPIHLEYLRNVGVRATMSVAIIVEGKLWGLLACHHRQEIYVDYRVRNVLSFFCRVLAGHLALQRSTEFRLSVMQTNLLRSRLLERMNEYPDLLEGLLGENGNLLQLADAEGAAVRLNGSYKTVGVTPTPDELEQITEYLQEQRESIYQTHDLFTELPAARSFSQPVAGLLTARLSMDPAEYIMWFRPEFVTTINWGGNPSDRKLVENGQVRLHPEISFKKWSQEQRGVAKPWLPHQIDAVAGLRNDIKEIILLRFQEIRRTNQQLVSAYEQLESFSYTVSHDLRAPLRSIKGYAEILEEDYADVLDDFGRTALDTIVTNVGKMNQFINDILMYSKLGRTNIVPGSTSLGDLIESIRNDVDFTNELQVAVLSDLEVDEVPVGYRMLQQVMLNLLTNAVKYARPQESPYVKVLSRRHDGGVEIRVVDNGIGFDMKYAERVFAMFDRLVSDEDYEGTGVGLAVVHRVVERHGGTITVESSPGVGTEFRVWFPNLIITGEGEHKGDLNGMKD